jgi:hypothetical protein
MDLWAYRKFKNWHEFEAYVGSIFGSDPKHWPFICPSCQTVSTGYQFEEIGADPALSAVECVGRHLPLADDKPVRGCTWTAYGLFSGPWFVGSEGIFPPAMCSPDISLEEAKLIVANFESTYPDLMKVWTSMQDKGELT